MCGLNRELHDSRIAGLQLPEFPQREAPKRVELQKNHGTSIQNRLNRNGSLL